VSISLKENGVVQSQFRRMHKYDTYFIFSDIELAAGEACNKTSLRVFSVVSVSDDHVVYNRPQRGVEKV